VEKNIKNVAVNNINKADDTSTLTIVTILQTQSND
jgi:hypothetical protein